MARSRAVSLYRIAILSSVARGTAENSARGAEKSAFAASGSSIEMGLSSGRSANLAHWHTNCTKMSDIPQGPCGSRGRVGAWPPRRASTRA